MFSKTKDILIQLRKSNENLYFNAAQFRWKDMQLLKRY